MERTSAMSSRRASLASYMEVCTARPRSIFCKNTSARSRASACSSGTSTVGVGGRVGGGSTRSQNRSGGSCTPPDPLMRRVMRNVVSSSSSLACSLACDRWK